MSCLTVKQEIKPSMIDPMKAKQSLKAAELQDGDIICFQLASHTKSDIDPLVPVLPQQLTLANLGRGHPSLSDRGSSITARLTSSLSDTASSIKSDLTSIMSTEVPSEATSDIMSDAPSKTPSARSPTSPDAATAVSSEAASDRTLAPRRGRIEDARDFYDFLLHRREVKFYPNTARNAGSDFEPFPLVLSSKTTYDQVADRVGEHLGVDPTHIRFWTVNATTGNPKAAVKRGQSQTLQMILSPAYSGYGTNNQRTDSLFFEILDMSLSELDTKKSIKVTWVSEGISKTETYDLLVPKNGSIEDLATALVKKADIDDDVKGGPIRFWEVHNHKLYRELKRDSGVIGINEYASIIAERVPEDEINADESTDFVSAFHFQSEPSKAHGIPFRFRLVPNEPFSETKKRLEKRTGLKGKNFEKIKFAVVKRPQHNKAQYLADGKIRLSALTFAAFTDPALQT